MDKARLAHELIAAIATEIEGREASKDMTVAQAVIDVVEENPGMTPEDIHNAWMEHKLKQGWTFGMMNVKEKTHPNLVPYGALSNVDKVKDIIFSVLGNFNN